MFYTYENLGKISYVDLFICKPSNTIVKTEYFFYYSQYQKSTSIKHDIRRNINFSWILLTLIM